jgi:type I restriction enzyme R subunit
MSTQSEQVLEDNLVKQLVSLGHNFVTIKDEDDLLANLKSQLEKHNSLSLSAKEFSRVLNHLNKGNTFEKARILRGRMQLERDNGDSVYLEFINQDHWCKNQFQVTNQVTMEGSYKNRYDVTLLINGIPLVQIELKRRGLELKEAFNQTNRYQKHSYFAGSGLFNYIQIFVISNGVNTKYYTNNRKMSFKQTFCWSDEHNKNINQLEEFADNFLEKCHLAKMITKYIVLNETQKILMVLRPYQYYATEAIVDRVKNTDKNGYIWHTTGSGKTLTSFKTSQILMKLPEVYKVVFVVDRKDLDYQTTKEFNSFSDGSVDGTDNTRNLVNQFAGTYKNAKGELKDNKLIVTTIQKLNTAISKDKYLKKMELLKNKKIVFIFDECHRSQFGETHKRIKKFFENHQMFGFTGTPIFVKNAVSGETGKKTTKELFNDCLHKYVITDAIRDENVLKFSIEYIGKYKAKEGSQNEIDIEVEDIDKKELLESPKRLEKITNYIIANHGRKTHSRAFTAMFCVSSIDTLTKYYDFFQNKKIKGEHNLKVATIFSFVANEDDKDANGFIPDSSLDITEGATVNKHSRDKLDEYIGHYNETFNTKFSTKDSQSYYNYYNDIAKKVKEQKIDILLVVNMFLTGFDSPPLNTLYVDKNLKYHGLIQAFSRTNRILNEQKSQGNIVCFRNLKKATDEAISLFSNKDAKETILVEPYEDYVTKFNKSFSELLNIAPTVKSVDNLESEDDELAFIKSFRDLMRLKNVLSSFADFKFDDLTMNEQSFEDYKSKYLDLHDKVKGEHDKEKVSILDDVDFELELIHRDDINVAYILRLLANLKDSKPSDREKQKKVINDLLAGDVQLRSKKELIEKFISENILTPEDSENIEENFESFWGKEKQKAIDLICKEEGLESDKLQEVIGNYIYTERTPIRDEIVSILKVKPKIRERKTITERVINKIKDFVETFIDGIGG